MYRYSNGQISLADFKQPVGMNLKEDNRWVKKAQTIGEVDISTFDRIRGVTFGSTVSKKYRISENRKNDVR